MKFNTYPYSLEFRHTFRLAHGSRTHTDSIFLKLEYDGKIGWGEATLPPYLPEKPGKVLQFLESFCVNHATQDIEAWKEEVNQINSLFPAKAALDMALWQIESSIQEKTVAQIAQVVQSEWPKGTYTIGASTPAEMEEKINDAVNNGFQLIKLKLTGNNDVQAINQLCSFTGMPFCVDANQGWKDVEYATKLSNLLADKGCLFIEQPFMKHNYEEHFIFKKKSALPVIADESFHHLSDLPECTRCFDGINVKLMKCGGITSAIEIMQQARKQDMIILLGCMSESSVGCTAAASISTLADYADLDGPYLLQNDPFSGMTVENGRIKLNPLQLKDHFKHLFTDDR